MPNIHFTPPLLNFMGNTPGAIDGDTVSELKSLTTFTDDELKRLHKRFKKIDKDGNGVLSHDEFQSVPSLANNPLVGRVMSIFDTDGDTNIDFREFIVALNKFTNKDASQEKLQFLFNVYDVDNDGKIGNGELFQVLKLMVGDNLTDVHLQQIVDKTIVEADTTGDGFINFEEFKKIVGGSDFGSQLHIGKV